MIKTYRRDDAGMLHYREAWADGSLFVVHEGVVGTKGKVSRLTTRGRARFRESAPTMAMRRRAFQAQAAADGYREVTDDEHGWVVLQIWTFSPDLSHPSDAWIFTEGDEALNSHLGWLGVGHLDGNDVGGAQPKGSGYDGTVLNLFCPVVDTALGVKAVRSFVRKFHMPSNYVIGSREPGADSEWVLAWSPRKSDRQFALLYD